MNPKSRDSINYHLFDDPRVLDINECLDPELLILTLEP